MVERREIDFCVAGDQRDLAWIRSRMSSKKVEVGHG
jgi:hypothetical protein